MLGLEVDGFKVVSKLNPSGSRIPWAAFSRWDTQTAPLGSSIWIQHFPFPFPGFLLEPPLLHPCVVPAAPARPPLLEVVPDSRLPVFPGEGSGLGVASGGGSAHPGGQAAALQGGNASQIPDIPNPIIPDPRYPKSHQPPALQCGNPPQIPNISNPTILSIPNPKNPESHHPIHPTIPNPTVPPPPGTLGMKEQTNTENWRWQREAKRIPLFPSLFPNVFK